MKDAVLFVSFTVASILVWVFIPHGDDVLGKALFGVAFGASYIGMMFNGFLLLGDVIVLLCDSLERRMRDTK